MVKTLFCVIALLFTFCTPQPSEKKYEVILLGGQSNMVGVGKKAEVSDTLLPSNVSYFDFGLTPKLMPSPGYFGPELSVGKMLGKTFPERNFILIKHAIGGASLYDWAPDYDPEKAKITGFPQFGNMFERLFRKADSITQGLDSKTVAMLWMQGERDARVPEAGVHYAENFKQFIEAVRERTGQSELPFLYGIINPPVEIYPALDTVRAAQRLINETIPNTYLIETEGLDKWEDQVHYSTAGQLELGRRFGQQLIKLLKE